MNAHYHRMAATYADFSSPVTVFLYQKSSMAVYDLNKSR